MNIIVAGSGKVGETLIEQLSNENHDVVVIDTNPKIIEHLVNSYDVLGICGNAASYEVQKEAGVASSDVFIALCQSDELNILSCLVAKTNGVKHTIARVIILMKSGIREIKRAINPRTVKCIKLDGAVVENETISNVNSYFAIYMVIIGLSTIIVSFNNLDFTSTLVSVITCINNVGPGLNVVGPTCNFSSLSNLSKLILVIDMLIGRLEIFPMIILLSPSAWKKNS